MNLAKPISRPSLHAELVDRVRELIIEGTLEPGTKIEAVMLEGEIVSGEIDQ